MAGRRNDGPSGVLFIRDQKPNDKAPDYSGTLEFDDAILTDLFEQRDNGVVNPKIDLIGWDNQSEKGTTYIRLLPKVENPDFQTGNSRQRGGGQKRNAPPARGGPAGYRRGDTGPVQQSRGSFRQVSEDRQAPPRSQQQDRGRSLPPRGRVALDDDFNDDPPF